VSAVGQASSVGQASALGQESQEAGKAAAWEEE